MSFGKRQPGKEPAKPAPFIDYGEIGQASGGASVQLSQLMVIAVVAVVAAAALMSLGYALFGSSRGEAVQVEAHLVDGSAVSPSAQARLVAVCIEHGLLKLSGGEGPTEAQRESISRGCTCTFTEIASKLSPLQTQMLYVDQRTRLRATMAQMDRTGERITVGGIPKLEAADNAAIALVASDRYDAHWREARDLSETQAARCKP